MEYCCTRKECIDWNEVNEKHGSGVIERTVLKFCAGFTSMECCMYTLRKALLSTEKTKVIQGRPTAGPSLYT